MIHIEVHISCRDIKKINRKKKRNQKNRKKRNQKNRKKRNQKNRQIGRESKS